MPLRIDSFHAAYRIAHAAGWDEANRRMVRQRRTSWNEADWDEAAATFRRVLGALGHSDPAACAEPEVNPRAAPHGKRPLLRRQSRHPARACAG